MAIGSGHVITRRHAMASLAAAALLPALSRSAAAAMPDYAAFNRNYVSNIVLPRIGKLRMACADWNEGLLALLSKPSAAKVSLIEGDIEHVSNTWMAVQPFRYLPSGRNDRNDSLAHWTDETSDLEGELQRLLVSNDLAELTPARMAQSVVGRQGLAAIGLLQYDDKGRRDMINDFYLDEKAERRCAILQAIVAHLLSAADDAEKEWSSALAQDASAFGNSAKETTARLLIDQIDMLKIVARRKIALSLGADANSMNFRVAEQWRMRRSTENIRINLQTIDHAMVSQFGWVNLLPAKEAQLNGELRDSVALLRSWIRSGHIYVPPPLITSLSLVGMCEFSCPDPKTLEPEAARRTEELRNRVIVLMVKINEVRTLLQTDFAGAVGLTTNLREMDTDEL